MDDYTPAHAALDTSDEDRRRKIRTAFQAFVSACAVLMVGVPVAMKYLEHSLSAEQYAALAGVAAAITAGATLVTRVMSAGPVVAWIDRFVPWLSAKGK